MNQISGGNNNVQHSGIHSTMRPASHARACSLRLTTNRHQRNGRQVRPELNFTMQKREGGGRTEREEEQG